jgi:deoxycytidylate deaminase
MKESTIQQCIRILLRDWKKDQSRPTYHYAFAIKKNRIIAVGKNKPEYPSKKAFVLGRTYNIKKWYMFPYLHAESDLITKLNSYDINRHLELLSLRINRHGEFRLAKPCHNCQKLLDQLNVTKITWSCNCPDRSINNLILQSQHKITNDIHMFEHNPLASNKSRFLENLSSKSSNI